MASSSSSPCAACKFLRRKCTAECVFAPYFPPDQPHKFANVHKIFGASNITKLLNELPVHQREDAVNSLAYEADARVKDPVYGCVGAISVLQRQVAQLQAELNLAHSDLARYAGAGGMMAVPGNVTQGLPSSSLGIGMNLSGPHPREQQQQMLSREQHYLDMAREPPQQLTRDQLRDIARVGGGSYEAGLAALGMAGSLGQLGPFPSRQGSDGGSSASGMGGHLSPP
ncbi:unnamed protein product [Calypogeia fissa]